MSPLPLQTPDLLAAMGNVPVARLNGNVRCLSQWECPRCLSDLLAAMGILIYWQQWECPRCLPRSYGVGNRGGDGVSDRKTTLVIAPFWALLYIETHLNLGVPATGQRAVSLGVQR